MKSILDNKSKLEEIVQNVKDILKVHHTIYDLPVKAELWENVLSNALKKSQVPNDWKPDFNHAQGVDMNITVNRERLSCKSGAIEKNNLKISGSRMTKHLTLESKLSFLSEEKDDTYMLLSRNKEEWNLGNKKYYFIAFPSGLLDYNSLSWEDKYYTRGKRKGQVSGHSGKSAAVQADIEYSMSHQLWTKILNFRENPDIFVSEISI